jgi:hypothetical protein
VLKATYGPTPPNLDASDGTNWGLGQNCTFTLSGGLQVPRLAWLGDGEGQLVKLTPSQLTDGPWCPDSAAPGRYDADLLRIRKVRVMLRVQAGQDSMRGVAGALFTRAGTSKSAYQFLTDQEIRLDVAPRNLNLGR